MSKLMQKLDIIRQLNISLKQKNDDYMIVLEQI